MQIVPLATYKPLWGTKRGRVLFKCGECIPGYLHTNGHIRLAVIILDTEKSYKINLKSDYIYYLPIDLETNRNPFSAKSIGK